MLKKILIGLSAIIVIFLIVVALQPADFRISRSAVIAAPPAAVFEQINDFQKWNEWSPWAKLDPNAKNAFEGPSRIVDRVFVSARTGEGLSLLRQLLAALASSAQSDDHSSLSEEIA